MADSDVDFRLDLVLSLFDISVLAASDSPCTYFGLIVNVFIGGQKYGYLFQRVHQ